MIRSGQTSLPNNALATGAGGSRVMLDVGDRQGVPIVTYGPFVGETHADRARVFQAYAEFRMPRVSALNRR